MKGTQGLLQPLGSNDLNCLFLCTLDDRKKDAFGVPDLGNTAR